MKYKALIFVLLPGALFFAGCQALQLPPLPGAQAQPSGSSATYKKKSGNDAVIVVNIPALNLAAQRFPAVYTKRYITGYMASWNDQVFQRQMRFRAYDGQFKSPASERNFHLYDGEQFDLEKQVQQDQLAQAAADKGPQNSNAFTISDETTASSTGREDGQRAAKQDFIRSMLPQEKF